jgi:hypothetical protein
MSTPTIAEPEAVNFETQFHIDKDVNDPENYLVIHELMGRGQLLNAYEAKMEHTHDVHFGEGILNKGKAKKREKRPLTQIEIMAAVEREKQEKKAARKAAKVRHRSRRLPPFFRVSIGTTDPSPPRIFPSGSRLAKLTHLFRRVSWFRLFAGGQYGGSHLTRGVRGERRRRQEADEERAQEARSRRV